MADNIIDTTANIEKLKNAIKEINGEIPDFAKGLQEGLVSVAKKLPDVVESMRRLNAENRNLAQAGRPTQNILKELAGSLFSWNAAISIGTTLLITYGGELLKWVKGLVTGKEKVSALAEALRVSKIVSESIIQTRLNGQKSAQAEITNLDTLYRATQKANNKEKELNDKKEERIKAAQLLQKHWPESFEQITTESIITGKAADAYKKLKNELSATAQVQIAKNTVAEQSNKILENKNKLEKEGATNAKLKAAEEKAKQDLDNIFPKNQTPLDAAIMSAKLSPDLIKNYTNRAKSAENERIASDKIIQQLNKNNSDHNKVISGQNEHIDKLVKQYGVSILNGNKAINSPEKKPTDDKFTTYNFKIPDINPAKPTGPTEEEIRKESADRMALLMLEGFAREVEETNQHFAKLKKEHQNNHATVEQLEREHQAKLTSITNKFQDEGLAKLASYSQELNKTSNDAHFDAIQQITAEYRVKAADIAKVQADNEKLARQAEEESLKLTASKLDITDKTKLAQIDAKIAALDKKRVDAQQVVDQAKLVATQLADKRTKDTTKVNTDFANERKHETLEGDIATAHSAGKWQQEFDLKQDLLNLETKQAIDAAQGKETAIAQIRKDAKDKQDQLDRSRLDAEVANQKKYVQGVDKLAGAITAIFGKNTVAARLAFKAQQAAAAAQVIIDTRQAIMGIWKANAGLPIIGVPKAIAETAIVVAAGAANLATIVKQKPGFAQGGQYVSDGRGALLSGYSRTDNTNAYLRSGEAVVVSEAMRNPWARNLVSAINVAHGGRDFSIANPGSGYAVGGIFTDGGNASRYYSQPLNDQKDLANTLAYQMINNFPPIYVDVKDVNNQQNILAQTVNRVTL